MGENDSIVWRAISGTPKAMKMKALKSCREGGDGTPLLFRSEYIHPPHTQSLGRIMDPIMIKGTYGKWFNIQPKNLKRISRTMIG